MSRLRLAVAMCVVAIAAFLPGGRAGSAAGGVTLVKGQNVLVLEVINEVNNWQGCARFLKDGKPVTDLAISVAPSGK